MSDWDSICEWCGDIFLRSEGELKKWKVRGPGDVQISCVVCGKCSDEEPCVANWKGIHGEVYVLAELADDGLVIPKELRPLFSEPPWSEVPPHQAGFCSVCRCQMVWSVKFQRWTTMLGDVVDTIEPTLSPMLARPNEEASLLQESPARFFGRPPKAGSIRQRDFGPTAR